MVPFYKEQQIKRLKILYLLSSCVWIYIIYKFDLMKHVSSSIDSLILLVPIVVFLVSILFMEDVTERVEKYMMKANFLTIGLIIALPLLNWIRDNSASKVLMTKLIATGIILSMLGIVDIWIPDDWLCFVKHVKSIFHTIAIILLIYGLYRFYVESCANFKNIANKLPVKI